MAEYGRISRRTGRMTTLDVDGRSRREMRAINGKKQAA